MEVIYIQSETAYSEVSPPRYPLISIIVPTRNRKELIKCLESLPRVKYPKNCIELIVVEGKNPSEQRNFGAQSAKGTILYFIDDDSELDPRALCNLANAFEDYPKVAGIGGPAVGKSESSVFQRSVAMALGSLFGFGPLRFRYYPSGFPHICSEDKLILANLAVRRECFQRSSGFDVRLYPNEENEFIRRQQSSGMKFLYHPSVIVRRPAQKKISELACQMFRYGRSRIKHLRIRNHPIHIFMYGPLVLALSCFVFPALLFTVNGSSFENRLGQPSLVGFYMVWLVYSGLVGCVSLYSGLSSKSHRILITLWHIVIYPTIHLSYGFGMVASVIFSYRWHSKKNQ